MAKRIFSTVTLWLVIFALATVSRANAGDFTIEHAGKISIDTLAGWSANARFTDLPSHAHGLNLEIFPMALKNQAVTNVKATLTITISNIDLPPSWDQRCAIMRDVFTRRFGKPKVDLKPYNIAQGRGAYFVFLDPKLVGKPSQTDHHPYKVVSPGLVDLNKGCVQIVANIYADDADGPEMTALRSIVESIRFTPPANP